MQIRTPSPGDQFKIKVSTLLRFWDLLPWEAAQAAGRRFNKLLEISRFIDILREQAQECHLTPLI